MSGRLEPTVVRGGAPTGAWSEYGHGPAAFSRRIHRPVAGAARAGTKSSKGSISFDKNYLKIIFTYICANIGLPAYDICPNCLDTYQNNAPDADSPPHRLGSEQRTGDLAVPRGGHGALRLQLGAGRVEKTAQTWQADNSLPMPPSLAVLHRQLNAISSHGCWRSRRTRRK